ncbi:MAG: site-specific integrase [Muribaculum sp.]|nr:site-specific integrase [Muribaculum sp.]
MFTTKFILREDKNNSIRLRVTSNRRSVQFSIGISATSEEMENALSKEPKTKLSQVGRLIRAYSAKVELATNEIINKGLENEDVRVLSEILKNALIGSGETVCPNDEKSKLFSKFYEVCMNTKKNKSYRSSCEYTLKKMRDYDNKLDSLVFEEIDLKWLNCFDEWLCLNGASQNTRCIHFKNIRTVINRAIDEELTEKYPFRRFKIKQELTRKRSLPVAEIRKLFSCDVEDYQEIYRDMFKLMFFLCGINAIDLYNLKSISSDGRIEYRRAKTHKLYSIKIEPEAMEIIEKYRGAKNLLSIADRWSDHKDFIKWMNEGLKKIGEVKIVGRGGKKKIKPFWPEISSYWSRHSWATIAYNDLDIPKDIIAQGLGHGKQDVTETYIKRDERKVDEANRKIIDWVLYGKLTS